MPLCYKVDVLQKLKEKGFSTYRLRAEKIIGERQLQQIRKGEIVSPACLCKLCELLNCQPGDIIHYVNKETPTYHTRCNECGVELMCLDSVKNYLTSCPRCGAKLDK